MYTIRFPNLTIKKFKTLVGADLREADFRGFSLRGEDLRGADLRGANLYAADLYGADLRGADLRRVNFQGADLHKARLHDANLRGADLRRANLQGADLSWAGLDGVDFREAIFNETRLHLAYITLETDFTGALLIKSIAGDLMWLFTDTRRYVQISLSEVLEASPDTRPDPLAVRDCGAKFVGMPHSDWYSTQNKGVIVCIILSF